MAIIIETDITELTVERYELESLRDWIAYRDQSCGVTVTEIMAEVDARIEFLYRLIAVAQSSNPPYLVRY